MFLLKKKALFIGILFLSNKWNSNNIACNLEVFLTIFVALQSIMQTTIFFLFYSTEIVNILVKFLALIKD